MSPPPRAARRLHVIRRFLVQRVGAELVVAAERVEPDGSESCVDLGRFERDAEFHANAFALAAALRAAAAEPGPVVVVNSSGHLRVVAD